MEPFDSLTHRYALSDFYDPDMMKEALDWYRAGMPRDLVPFASDSSGSQLAFSKTEMALTDGRETRVYFWDHDLLQTDIAGETFDAFLRLYIPE